MLVSNGTRVALKANPPSPVTEPPVPPEQTTNSDSSTASEPEAFEQQPAPDQKPESVKEVLSNNHRNSKVKVALICLLVEHHVVTLMPVSHGVSSCLSAG